MKELKDTLWRAADKLRGSLPANQYKDVILGLVFLKYVSDAVDEGRETTFVVPAAAHWSHLAEHAKGRPADGDEPERSIGYLVDAAMDALMEVNESLRSALPRGYQRDTVDQRRLGELIDLFNSARFSRRGEHRARDLMGEVYEYFLGNFARAEGRRGGEFFTPPSVVKVLVEVLAPARGRVYDPCCGSGGMFVQTERFVHEHDGDPKDIAVFGQEAIDETWRMARMNLAIHGIANNGLGSGPGDTFARDLHAGVQMDYVLANPPFNIKSWTRNAEDERWRFGVPPVTNANYAWIQHVLWKLAPGGKAGIVMANGSMSSQSGGEGAIRAEIVKADLVSCMIALPTQLFRSTGIPVCLWFLAKGKGAGRQGSADRTGQVLFVDARELGYMVDRAERALTTAEIVRIGDTYHAWRGSPSAAGTTYQDVPGFCRSATLDEIKAADYVLTPGRYVVAAEIADDGEAAEAKIERLTEELLAAFRESARREQVVRRQLELLDG